MVQLGITIVGAVAAATSGAGAEELLEPVLRGWGGSETASQFLAIAIVVALLTVVTIVLGELVPKVFALRNKEWVCLKLSPAMQWFSFSVWPAVWCLDRTVTGVVKWGEHGWGGPDEEGTVEATIQDLRAAASMARMPRMIGRREEEIIVSASRLAAQ